MLSGIFDQADHALSFVPAWLRLCIYGALAGAVAMMLYGRLSPQQRLQRIQTSLAGARARMLAYDGDDVFEVVRRARHSLVLSLRQVGLVAPATVVAAVPVLLIAYWLDGAYSHRLPDPGTPTAVEFQTGEGMEPAPGSPFPWPEESAPVVLRGPSASALLTLPLAEPRTRITRRPWWSALLHNPAGYLPDDGEVTAVEIQIPERHFVRWGPPWLRGWHALFLVSLSVAAVAIKNGLGIR